MPGMQSGPSLGRNRPKGGDGSAWRCATARHYITKLRHKGCCVIAIAVGDLLLRLWRELSRSRLIGHSVPIRGSLLSFERVVGPYGVSAYAIVFFR